MILFLYLDDCKKEIDIRRFCEYNIFGKKFYSRWEVEYITIKEAADKWNLSVRRVQCICMEGKIKGVKKFGHAWAIPENAEKPKDNRIRSGKYIKLEK